MDEIKELLEKMKAKLAEIDAEGDLEKKKSLLAEFNELKAQKEFAEELEAAEKALVAGQPPIDAKGNSGEAKPKGYDAAVKEFASAARKGFKGLNETAPADGGYTVPEDISTQIIKLREAKRSLRDLVSVESVKTLSGERTYKKRDQKKGFSSVSEGGKIPATGIPQFARIPYKIEKYGGYMPITNELLDDTDANLVGEIMDWFADESRVTDNKLILATLNEPYTRAESPKAEKKIGDFDDVKYVLNVTLGQAFKPTSKVVTNDSGLQWLDTMKDEEKNYKLTPSPADPMALRLAAGATTVPLEIVPNSDLEDEAVYAKTADTSVVDGKTYYTLEGGVYSEVESPAAGSISTYYEMTGYRIPVYIGDLKEAVKLFDRKQLSIMASNVAAVGDLNAFEQDLTLYRGTLREDCELFDDEAYVKCYIEVSAVAAG